MVNTNDVLSIREAATSLRSAIDAELRGDTLFIDISASASTADVAYQIAKYTSEGFVSYSRNQYTSDALSSIDTLQTAKTTAQDALRKAQQAMLQFQRKSNIANLEERKNLLEKQFSEVSTEVDLLANQIDAHDKHLDQIKKLGIDPGAGHSEENIEIISQYLRELTLIPSISEDANFQKRFERYEAVHNKVLDLAIVLKERHPVMENAQKEANSVRRVLIQYIAEIPRNLKARLTISKGVMEVKRARMDQLDNQMIRLDELAAQHTLLKQDLDIAKGLVEQVQGTIQGIELTSTTEGNDIRVQDEASPPITIHPNKKQTVLLGLLSGLLLSYALLYLLHTMDQSIKTVEQAEQVLQLPVIAAVPASEPDLQPAKSRQVMLDSPSSTCSEAFRSLRVNIESMARNRSNKVVLFTSSLPSEGKTFTSINYAASLAQQGHRTLLIDFDLRKPAIAKEFSIPNEYTGVTDLVLSKDKLEAYPDLAIYEASEKLFVLHGGNLIDNPAEHLAGNDIETIVKKSKENFDRVVIDSAPLGPVGDTLSVAGLADMVCLVVRSAKTTSKIVLRIIDSLHRHGQTPAGIILNYVEVKANYGSYYYYYSSSKEKTYPSAGYKKKEVSQYEEKEPSTQDADYSREKRV
ncbi:MAG: polysaccharide biosynthesis tyrosine autokinase [Verrucomicrobiota bacterium]|nr:polysaccharide biosynthesis tyrosine autokinase [Verrucomicrobiota bacterium]